MVATDPGIMEEQWAVLDSVRSTHTIRREGWLLRYRINVAERKRLFNARGGGRRGASFVSFTPGRRGDEA